ncbi:hypothetical protein QYM36_008034 [Artemia franciscana]|uniref:Uncharacterized protein n=1 Tax=Artemia franciscana TaxID=6661 RepID=A0AA88ITX6_ARTSF|nr:hypothetical protein QYM36_008034 [Artemia franciscana]
MSQERERTEDSHLSKAQEAECRESTEGLENGLSVLDGDAGKDLRKRAPLESWEDISSEIEPNANDTSGKSTETELDARDASGRRSK